MIILKDFERCPVKSFDMPRLSSSCWKLVPFLTSYSFDMMANAETVSNTAWACNAPCLHKVLCYKWSLLKCGDVDCQVMTAPWNAYKECAGNMVKVDKMKQSAYRQVKGEVVFKVQDLFWLSPGPIWSILKCVKAGSILLLHNLYFFACKL